MIPMVEASVTGTEDTASMARGFGICRGHCKEVDILRLMGARFLTVKAERETHRKGRLKPTLWSSLGIKCIGINFRFSYS